MDRPIPPVSPQSDVPLPPPQPLRHNTPGLNVKQKWYQNRKKRRGAIIVAVGGVLIITFLSFLIWYTQSIRPLSANTNKLIIVTVDKGMSPDQIGSLLQKNGVIRSATAFVWYTKFTRTGGSLQYGTYRLTPSDAVSAIVKHLANGEVDTFKITFLPGATLADNRSAFIDAGYSTTEVDAALSKTYKGIIFTDKPASTDLEGYIYGDSYNFNAGTSVATILQAVFDRYSEIVQSNNLIAAYKKQGLNLYQGITLASIIQREMGSPNANIPTNDQKQVAQVFYSRLAQGMPLGSDVTYQYAAKKLGVTPTPTLSSPYNTRITAGLPPGPIAVPSKAALLAAAQPAPGDYLFFLSGDDGKTYFARTNTEHEQNIKKYCQQKCSSEQ